MQRRDFFKTLGTVAVVGAALPMVTMAAEEKKKGPNAFSYNDAISAITAGKVAVKSDKVHLKVPEIAENGAVVPVTVEVDSPMTPNDYVKAIHILDSKNNNARCVDAFLSPANGKALLSTRVKLGGTQDVIALVELSNGTYLIATQNVKVTIGGCG